jgi:hypothetical protein
MGVLFCLRVADVGAVLAPDPQDRCEICDQRVWGDHGDEWWPTNLVALSKFSKHVVCTHCISQTPTEWIDD